MIRYGPTVPDAVFDHPRLARVYDPLDPDRSDLDVYAAIVDELGARRVLDVGCGTGTFACLLARRGIEVTGVDPAGASLDVARTKAGADRVRWIHGDATTLPDLQVDLVVMTANVAQVFLTDDEWMATLDGVRAALRPDGWLVFETRVPERQVWRDWTRQTTYHQVDLGEIGVVESWTELVTVEQPFVSFRSWTTFASDGAVLVSDSTLRFRSRAEVEQSLHARGFALEEVRDAPDRPGLEMVFIAQRGSAPEEVQK